MRDLLSRALAGAGAALAACLPASAAPAGPDRPAIAWDDPATYAGAPALLAPEALVVVGEKASEAERQIARRLALGLRKAGGPATNLVTDRQVNADLELAASSHLLVVGTVESNRVMQRFPSHWALDRDRYYADRAPFEPWMPTRGYSCAGYGTFVAGDVGYVECDRNPYWHYLTNLVADSTRWPPYRHLVRLTGNTGEGVRLAVEAFVRDKLLTAAVPAGGLLPAPRTSSVSTPRTPPGRRAPRRGSRAASGSGTACRSPSPAGTSPTA
jgi:hypothetical protein